MDAPRRDLRARLRATAQLATVVAGRLRDCGDWQYAAAVAMGAYADDYARHLKLHLRAERIDDFAWRLTRHAVLCTRELAPIAPLWEQASVLAWQMRSVGPAQSRGPVKERVVRACARPSASFTPQSLLRALFAG